MTLTFKYCLILSEHSFRNGHTAKEIQALSSRVNSHTFFSDGEDMKSSGIQTLVKLDLMKAILNKQQVKRSSEDLSAGHANHGAGGKCSS